MAFYYRAFGLIFKSSEPLPWLAGEPASDRFDVRIDFNAPPLNQKPETGESIRAKLPGADPSSEPLLTIWQRASDARFRFRYRDGTEFTVSADGNEIKGSWPKRSTIEDAATYLLGPITGFILRLHGTICLHASAISDSKRGLALMAPGGLGKSSSAAAFAQGGYHVLTDDILALEEHGNRFHVLPGWPHLRLWPSSVAALFGRPDALPRLCPANADWDKRYWNLSPGPFRFQTDPMPLSVIYAAKNDPGSSAVRIEPMGRLEALRQLLSNTYSWYSLDGSMRAAELDCLVRLAQQVPVRSFTICTQSPHRLRQQCRSMIEDAASEGIDNLFRADYAS